MAGLSLVAVNGRALGDIWDTVEGPGNTIGFHYLVEKRLKL